MEFVSSLFKKQEGGKKYSSTEAPPPYDDRLSVQVAEEKSKEMTEVSQNKKETIKKCCESGDLKLLTELIIEIHKTIIPDEYENYILISCENNRDNICQYLLKINLYPLDDNIYKYAIVLACETGNITLYTHVHSKISSGGGNFYFLTAIKNNQYELVELMCTSTHYGVLDEFEKPLGNKTFHLNPDKCKKDSSKNKILMWGSEKDVLSDLDKEKLIIRVQHPLEISMSKSDMKMLKILLPVFNNKISTELKSTIVQKIIKEGTKEDFDLLKTTDFIKTYDKKYFDVAKYNPQIISSLIEYYQADAKVKN
jgi:hypothetical protein